MRVTKLEFDLGQARKSQEVMVEGTSFTVERCDGEAYIQLDTKENAFIPLHTLGAAYNASFKKIYISNSSQFGKKLVLYVTSDGYISRNVLNLRDIADALKSQQIYIKSLVSKEIVSQILQANTILGNFITAGKISGITGKTVFDLDNDKITIAGDKIALGRGVLPNGSDGVYIKNANLYIDGGLLADHIAAFAITAEKLNVSELSAITSNVGTLRSGKILSQNDIMDINLNGGTINIYDARLIFFSSRFTTRFAISAFAEKLDIKITLSPEAAIAKIGRGVLPNGGDGIYIKNANLYVDGGILADHIASFAITAEKIAANAITADKIAAGAITADKIAAGTITGDKIAANTITANKLNISYLSAISANLGTINAGTVNGITINGSNFNVTSSSGAINFNSSGWQIKDGGLSDYGYINFNFNSVTRVSLSAGSNTDVKLNLDARSGVNGILIYTGYNGPPTIYSLSNGSGVNCIRFYTSSPHYIGIHANGLVIPNSSNPVSPSPPPAGYMVFNTSTNVLWIYNGSQWRYITTQGA